MSADIAPEEIVALNRLATVARVLAGTAHDLNNALQIISGTAEMLAGQTDLPEPARRGIQRIQSQSNRAAAAVHEVMQFARDHGGATARVSLRDVAAKAAEMRGFQIRRAGLVLTFESAAAPAALVQGRASHLQQAVLNLIMNAEQALQGRRGGAISLDLREDAGDAVLRVADNGCGLAAEIESRAFEPFVTTHPVPDSSGLGLTAARFILESHRGSLMLERQDQGCCATLRLPLAASA